MPHTRSPPFRRRIRWPSLLLFTSLISALWLPLSSARSNPRRFAPDGGNEAAADYLIRDLPGAPKPLLKMYAGHIEVTPEHHGNLFFWLYQNRKPAKKDNLVIWFNGGPGCSSMDGALMEIGPYRVNEDGTLRLQEGGWDEFASVLFIDNPVGTGFSYVDGDALVHDLAEMSDQIIVFLEKWFAIFTEFAHHDIYIAGESYAGQHIPYIATSILDRNAEKSSSDAWSLKGLMIGNGWISGQDQYTSYIPFMYEQGILVKGSTAANNADDQQEKCKTQLAAGDAKKVDTSTCEMIMMGLSRDLSENGQCYNVYDVRLKDSYPSCGMNWPPDLAQLKPYLRRDDVRRALNLNPDQKAGWSECNNQVNFAFNAAHSLPAKDLLPRLLENMPVILFSGDKDLICNHIGTEHLISNMSWNGGFGMEVDGETAPIREWTMEGEPAGQYQEARDLIYWKFYNSSHMVPFDYPKRARDMLDRFTGENGKTIFGRPKNSIIEGVDNEKEVVPPKQDQDQDHDNGSDKSPTTSGDDNNKAIDDEADSDWTLYYRSGEAALVVVVIAAVGWGFFVWRSRRRRALGYKSVMGDDPDGSGGPGRNGAARGSRLGLATAEERFRNRERDLEAAAEEEMDELSPSGEKMDKERFAVGDDEDEDDGGGRGRANGLV